jgi:hypothetical protein
MTRIGRRFSRVVRALFEFAELVGVGNQLLVLGEEALAQVPRTTGSGSSTRLTPVLPPTSATT